MIDSTNPDVPEWYLHYRAERTVIGAALLSAEAAERVASAPLAYFASQHGKECHKAIRDLVARGITPSAPLLLQEVKADASLAGYVMQAVEEEGAYDDVEHWLGVLADRAIVRKMYRLMERLKQGGEPVERLIEKGVGEALALARKEGGTKHLAAAAAETWNDESPPVCQTGIRGLDSVLGIRPGHLVYIAATPGMGKTSLAVQMSDMAAEDGLGVLFVSLEMSAEEIAKRLLARHGIEGKDSGLSFLQSRTIWYDESQTVAGIRAAVAERNPDLVIVDYIGLLAPEVVNKSVSRVNELAAISRSLKLLARTNRVPVVAMSQLNRQAAEGTPRLHHLRDSGALEADADAVLLIYEKNGSRFVDLAKHRHGAIGTWEAVFDAARCRFS